ncbi:hypothetical protein CSA80_05180 [Candidatus Saccharibacteria bacterium]|nr:MAG: hypothetical protein CSA80_05180 [Candidatus Saccharibacteria bacterium]
MKQFYNLTFTQFAAPYGECSYNESEYDKTGVCGATTDAASGLADTGVAVLAFIAIAAAILFAAMVVRIWRRPAKGQK